MSLYSRLDRLAADVEKLNRQVTAVANSPQSQRTSVEGGSIDFNDADGNLMAIMGGQDDGSNTIRHVDGPTPPIPSGLSAHVDGPIVQVSWDGTFESDVTHDWHYLEVLAVGPNNEQLTGTIDNADGGSTSLAATSQGDWVITARSVSRAGKRSLDGDAGTVAVQLVGLTGAIDAIQESANGKNTIYYSPTEPDAPDGGFNNGDLWFDTSEEGNNTASVWDGNGWVSMEDARLATIIAAQEALESDLQDVQTSVDGKNTITYDPALPPASYVGAVGDTWYRTSGNSMIGFWKWDGAAWVQQELSTTVIPQIDIGSGTFGSLNGARLTAGSVAASSIAVGDFTNLATIDPVRNINVTRPSNWATETVGDFIRTKATSQDVLMFKDRTDTVPFGPGDSLRIKYRVKADAQTEVQFRLWAYPQDSNGASTGQRQITSPYVVLPPWTTNQEVVLDIPEDFGDGVIYKSWIIGLAPQPSRGTTRVLGVRDVSIYRMTGRTLIQDGAITTDKLAVGAITAESGIIESLDLGTATVGELDGIRIMGQSIRGEQLSGDAIDGKVITGPTIQSAREGQRWVGDTTGIRIFNADNEVRTKLSPDDSVFKGEVEADTLIVNGGSELRSTENKLGQGAKLTLESGVTDPTAPPVVQPFWDGIDFDTSDTGTRGVGLRGLAWDGTHYWTTYAGNLPEQQFSAFRINPADGSVSRYYDVSIGNTTNVSEWFGVTCIGSELFWFYRRGYQAFVVVTDLSLAKLREWEYPNLGYSNTNPLGYKPGIGNDGTNIFIVHCSDGGSLRWRSFAPSNGALLTELDANNTAASNVTGVYVGAADWGGRWVAATLSRTNRVDVYATSGLWDGTKAFQQAEPGSVGLVFSGGKFRTIHQSGTIHEYAADNMGDETDEWWATYRWSVDLDDDGFNDYTSRIGPVKRFTWPRRSKVRFMGAPLPVGVEYITPSIAKKATTPSRTDFRTPSFSVYTGESTAWFNSLPSGWQSGAAPGDTNDFPDAEPSTLVSASSTFEVKGDGSGKWGPLTFNTDGTAKAGNAPLGDTGWIDLPAPTAAFTEQENGAYRVVNGVVYFRGRYSTGGTGTQTLMTLPPAIRPTFRAVASVAVNTGVRHAAEVGADGVVTIYYSSASGAWANISALHYPLG